MIASAGELEFSSAAPDPRRLDLLEELLDLTTTATERAARSSTFRLALTERTPFTPEDLERHLAECEHELRAQRLKEEAHDSEAHFKAHARAWCLDASGILEEWSNLAARADLEEGGDLAVSAGLDESCPWFAEGYGEWHRSLAALAKRRETLNEARSAIDAGDPGLATIRENFEAGSAKLDAALNYHEREEKRAIGDVEVLQATIEHHKWVFKAWTESYANANDHRVREKLAAKCNAFGRQLNRQARHLVTEYSRYETQRERPESTSTASRATRACIRTRSRTPTLGNKSSIGASG